MSHCHFLAYILDPRRPHGFGDAIFQRFLDALLDDMTVERLGLSALDVHLADLKGLEIRREWKRTDIRILLPSHKLVVVVELKIEAAEGKNQLQQYRKLVER